MRGASITRFHSSRARDLNFSRTDWVSSTSCGESLHASRSSWPNADSGTLEPLSVHIAHACSRSTSAGGVRMCPSAVSTLKVSGRGGDDMKSKARRRWRTKGFWYQADNTLRRLTLPLSSHYRSTPSKCKSARFEKPSQEIGVPRGKKSERYRSTPHYRSRSLKMKSARFEKASEEIGVPRGKKSERYRSTAHRQTDRHDLFRFRASVYPW